MMGVSPFHHGVRIVLPPFGPFRTHQVINGLRGRGAVAAPGSASDSATTPPQLNEERHVERNYRVMQSAIDIAREQITLTRAWTNRVLDQTDPSRWFEMPPGCPSHVAWQVGHLAMAEQRLGIHFVRDSRPADEAVLSATFVAPFSRGSVAVADPSAYPSAATLRESLDRIHAHLLQSLEEYREMDMNAPVSFDHPIVKRRIDALFWLARHEMLHAGQIGLIRRMQGESWIW